ncbi:MAG: hypothetical protein Q9219_001710 [cf. Caloplaca sp. 3 TL-2023]
MAIPSHCGRNLLNTDDLRSSLIDADDTTSPTLSSLPTHVPKVQRPLQHIVLGSWRSSYLAIFNLLNVPNPTFAILLIFLINGLAVRVEVLLPQYTSLVLRWPLSTVNSAIALKYFVSAVVLFGLPTFRKRYLEPRLTTAEIDLSITEVSLTANTIGVVGIGLSAPAAFFLVALCVYESGAGLADSLTAYGTFTLPPDAEISEFYVRTTLINTLASLVGGPMWNEERQEDQPASR